MVGVGVMVIMVSMLLGGSSCWYPKRGLVTFCYARRDFVVFPVWRSSVCGILPLRCFHLSSYCPLDQSCIFHPTWLALATRGGRVAGLLHEFRRSGRTRARAEPKKGELVNEVGEVDEGEGEREREREGV